MKRIRPGSKEPWLTIVGVVPDLLMEGIGNNNASPVGYYIPIAQSDVANGVRIAVRTRGDAAAVTPLVRSAVTSLDPDLAIYEISTLRRVIDRQTWFYTVFGTFFMAFGICALLLAAAGLYGVMSFAVTQRTREMGVRSALGAQGAQLVLLVMRKSVSQLAIGLFLGLGLALLASGALQPVLYHVNPRDAAVFAAVVVTLAVVEPDRELPAGAARHPDRPGPGPRQRVRGAIGAISGSDLFLAWLSTTDDVRISGHSLQETRSDPDCLVAAAPASSIPCGTCNTGSAP